MRSVQYLVISVRFLWANRYGLEHVTINCGIQFDRQPLGCFT